jgi:phasin family protein
MADRADANKKIARKGPPAKSAVAATAVGAVEAAKAAPAPTKVAETIQNTMNKAQENTQQAAQQATEQFRGALNDVNERGKVAIEKSARLVEEMADLTRGNLEAFVASQKTAAKYVETLTQASADYSRRSFEEASTALRSFAEAKSPTDIFRLQSDYARSAFDAMISQSARVSETVVKMTGEVAEPITSRYAVAAERVKNVAN